MAQPAIFHPTDVVTMKIDHHHRRRRRRKGMEDMLGLLMRAGCPVIQVSKYLHEVW